MLTNDEAVKILDSFAIAIGVMNENDGSAEKHLDLVRSVNNFESYVLSLVSEEAQPEDDEPLKVGDRVKIKPSDEHEWSLNEGVVVKASGPSFSQYDWRVKMDGNDWDVDFRSSELEKIR